MSVCSGTKISTSGGIMPRGSTYQPSGIGVGVGSGVGVGTGVGVGSGVAVGAAVGSGSASGTTAALQPAKKMPIARSIAKSSIADMQRLAVRCFVVFIGRSPFVEGIVFRDLQTVPFEV